jgi:putative transposase
LPASLEAKRALIEPRHPDLSIRRQCTLLGVNRASFDYIPVPENPENLHLMRLIDQQDLETPFYGWPRMTAVLRRQGYPGNRKRVRRLRRLMGLQALVPHTRTMISAPGHRMYPYLLRNLAIERPNQVWCTDITYVPMRTGFLDLVAVMDWFSRYVLTWGLANSLDGSFCRTALQAALADATPTIFNTDQGSQFTAQACTTILETAGVRISMDGRGRAFDNIMIERLWRSVKYAHLYLHEHETGADVYHGLDAYFQLYNHERPHQGLGYRTPAEVYRQR